jgi:phosphoadenosine phosphosulfate reductase
MNEAEIIQLTGEIQSLSQEDALLLLAQRYSGSAVFSTSFSTEDQVITHLIAQQQLPVTVFTLDTGRLFPETYSVWSRTLEFYGIGITAYYPDTNAIETFVQEKGPNAFYESIELRQNCCRIRKVEPLKRALAGKKLWITGLRREHSPERKNLNVLEWDAAKRILKYHPLLEWTTAAVKDFVNKNAIPYNPLHDKGFVSIGCAPCTRAAREGEDLRAGRWWWEDTSKKECGLHTK